MLNFGDLEFIFETLNCFSVTISLVDSSGEMTCLSVCIEQDRIVLFAQLQFVGMAANTKTHKFKVLPRSNNLTLSN